MAVTAYRIVYRVMDRLQAVTWLQVVADIVIVMLHSQDVIDSRLKIGAVLVELQCYQVITTGSICFIRTGIAEC